MYRPPQNSNRVKSIKSKFENIEYKSPEKSILTNGNGHRNNSPKKSDIPVNSAARGRQTNEFGNNENKFSGKTTLKNGPRNNLNNSPKKTVLPETSPSSSRQSLQRQYSDPAKRNIKRTPAFRVDKSVESFQRNCFNRSTLFETKVKQFSAVKSNCDSNCNLIHSEKRDLSKNNVPSSTNNSTKPPLIKSKSSHDFQYIRSKFDKGIVNDINKNCPSDISKKSTDHKNNFNISDKLNGLDLPYQCKTNINDKLDGYDLSSQNHDAKLNSSYSSLQTSCNINGKLNGLNLSLQSPPSVSDKLNGIDLSLLYTEPLPKSLRGKNSENDIILNIENSKPKLDNIYSTSTLKLSDKPPVINEELPALEKCTFDALTDTLKLALKKPLPCGPAPRKPPRTFQHAKTGDNLEKNRSFLHITKQTEKALNSKPKNSLKKADPKYMLNKLENALRNNKLRARRQPKVDISTTSGEDSDDSVLFRSKSNRTLPKLPSYMSETQDDNFAFNLNCLNGLGCTNTNYEKIKEPTSSFFVGRPVEEPVYAEPYHYRRDSLDSIVKKRENSVRSRSTRNSLYYMSTPVLNDEGKIGNTNRPCGKQDLATKVPDLNGSLNRQISTEDSSLSSFTSDLDSTPSPMDETAKIKTIIECFETKSQIPNGSPNIYEPIDSTNRVENLKNSLKQTLDKSFKYDCAIRDSDSEKNDHENKVADIIAKFQTYIKSMPKYSRPKISKDTLFYCCLIIEKVRDVAQIKFKYPSYVDIPHNIETLCFPEADSVPLDITSTAQVYSLLITNDKGERMFGYCRRVLPEGSTRCLPLAYCILSKYRAPRFYKKILMELESRHGIKNRYRDELICQFYNHKFPKPGESIKINLTNIEPKISKTDNKENFEESVELTSYVHINKTGEYGSINKVVKKTDKEKIDQIFISEQDVKNSCTSPSYIVENGGRMELILTLHPDTRYEDSDLKRLHQLPADILLKIFSSLLLERKVILISSMISKLSSCVDSLQSILYPFTWHHTFIPILPESLWDIVESPTPVICGVLSNEVVEYHNIENGIVVDLDSRTVLVEEGDENKILSGSMQKVWKRSLALANKAAASMDYVHSVYLSDAYLQVFIMCIKDYKKYFVDGNFQKEEFIKHGKTKGIRRFLKMFTETYMFLAFLDAVVNNPENLVAFDKKIEMYGSDESSIILDKLLEWHR